MPSEITCRCLWETSHDSTRWSYSVESSRSPSARQLMIAFSDLIYLIIRSDSSCRATETERKKLTHSRSRPQYILVGVVNDTPKLPAVTCGVEKASPISILQYSDPQRTWSMPKLTQYYIQLHAPLEQHWKQINMTNMLNLKPIALFTKKQSLNQLNKFD